MNDLEKKLLKEIEQAGLMLDIEHTRFGDAIDFTNPSIQKFGFGIKGTRVTAITEARLYTKENWEKFKAGEEVKADFFGHAFCSSKDQFKKSMGRTIAIGRAMKKYREYMKQESELHGRLL